MIIFIIMKQYSIHTPRHEINHTIGYLERWWHIDSNYLSYLQYSQKYTLLAIERQECTPTPHYWTLWELFWRQKVYPGCHGWDQSGFDKWHEKLWTLTQKQTHFLKLIQRIVFDHRQHNHSPPGTPQCSCSFSWFFCTLKCKKQHFPLPTYKQFYIPLLHCCLAAMCIKIHVE